MKLSAAEYEIMECVWALGRPVSGMDIMRALGQEKGWNLYHTERMGNPLSGLPCSAAACHNHFLPILFYRTEQFRNLRQYIIIYAVCRFTDGLRLIFHNLL